MLFSIQLILFHVSLIFQESRYVATEIDNATGTQTADRQHWWFLPKELQIRYLSSYTVRSVGVPNKNDEHWICKYTRQKSILNASYICVYLS